MSVGAISEAPSPRAWPKTTGVVIAIGIAEHRDQGEEQPDPDEAEAR